MNRTVCFLSALCALFAVVGCATAEVNPELAVMGKYRGEMKLPPAMENSPEAAMLKALGDPSLELKDDHTFIMLPGSVEGKWAFQPGKVVLTPEKVAGMLLSQAREKASAAAGKAGKDLPTEEQMGKPMELMIEEGGKVLRSRKEGSGQGDLIFTAEPKG